ncbi:MAG TPA: hypothetical protein VF146_19605, partial [Bryobacteraceae bacterium]
MKSSRLLLLGGATFLLVAALPAWANASRAVYAYGPDHLGYVHRVMVTGNTLKMQIGQPHLSNGYPDPQWFAQTPTGQVTSGYFVCQAYTYNYDQYAFGAAIGIAQFNFDIYVAFTALSSCNNSNSDMHVYVAEFNPVTQKWIGTPRDVGKVQHRRASGAALSVMHGRVYLFTDNGTWFTGDPAKGWTLLTGAIAPTGYEPLDAVTIYPADAGCGVTRTCPPRVLLAYGRQANTDTGYYAGIDLASWDGTIGTGTFGTPVVPVEIATGSYTGNLSLQIGTAHGIPYGFSWNGATVPAVQIDANTFGGNPAQPQDLVHFEYKYTADGGTWAGPSTHMGGSIGDLWTYTWYQLSCDPAVGAVSHQAIHQFIVTEGLYLASYHGNGGIYGGSLTGFDLNSDYQVPQNKDVPINACGDTGGTTTPDADLQQEIAQHYWTLVGVVLGAPPFAENGVTLETAIKELSNVDYAAERSTGVTGKQEWEKQTSFSAGLEVSAGFFEGAVSVSNSFDIGYKHAEDTAHETESSTTVAQGLKMGTSALGEIGKLGWALFNVPTINVQDWAIYAYNYNSSTGAGTALNQHLLTVAPTKDGTSVKQVYFELEDPSKGEIAGLMAGMGFRDPVTKALTTFPSSEDLVAWHAMNWTSADSPWEIVTPLGLLRYTKGSTDNWVKFAQEDSDVTTVGETNALDISNESTLKVGMGENGFKLNFKVGVDSSFKTSISNTTTMNTEVVARNGMVACPEGADHSKCIGTLEIQPFLLKAKATAGTRAPWIPDAFKDQNPWCMTWKVNQACPETATTCPNGYVINPGSAGVAAATYQGVVLGTSLPPRHASGRIVGGQGGGDQGDPSSHYTLQGGRLFWIDEGVETRIPMTADTFVPSKGVSLELGGLSWSSIGATGDWTRSAGTWTFTSGGQVQQNRVLLTLDFGNATFDLQLSKIDFHGKIHAGARDVPLSITLNGLYEFRTV